MVSDDAPDEFHSPCWQSLTTTTCRWCAPTQLALIQTWDRGRNIRRGGMSGFFSPLWVVPTKLIKQGAGSRVLTKTRTLRKRRRRRKKELLRAQDGGLCVRVSSSPRFPTSLPVLSIPPEAFGEKNVKWSRFCEHHLAARSLIAAPLTSLTLLPAHYITAAPWTFCSAGGESRRATHYNRPMNKKKKMKNWKSLNSTTLTTTRAIVWVNVGIKLIKMPSTTSQLW